MSARPLLGLGPWTTPAISQAKARWLFLAALVELGESGPLGGEDPKGLRRISRGWSNAGGGDWDDPAAVAALPSPSRERHCSFMARKLFDTLPAEVNVSQAAALALWAERWNLEAGWILDAAARILESWARRPARAESLDVLSGMPAVAYFTPKANVDPLTGKPEIPSGWEATGRVRARELPLAARFVALARYQCRGESMRGLAKELQVTRPAVSRHIHSMAELLPLKLRR